MDLKICLLLIIISSLITTSNTTLFLSTTYFAAYQVRLQIFNNHTIQPFSFPNNQPTAVIHNLGLVLSGYDFSSMVNIQFNASISLDSGRNMFQIILFKENTINMNYINYFIVAIDSSGSQFINVIPLCFYNNKDFTSELINSTLRKTIEGPYFYNTSISKIKTMAMLRSIKTNSSNVYAYFNILYVNYINNTKYIEIHIQNKHGRLKEICISVIVYHETIALSVRPSLYTSYSISTNYLDSSIPKFRLAEVSNRNFDINRLFGPVFEPQCLIGYQSYMLQSRFRQVLTFNMSQNGFNLLYASQKYLLNYSYFCLVDISCEGSKMIYYPSIQKCQPICELSNCKTCTSSTSCIECSDAYFLTQLYICSNCPPNCKQCKNSKDCTNCSDYYYLNSGTCLNCPSQCIKCNASGCHSCNEGFVISANLCAKCSSIMPYCDLCTYTIICDRCAEPYIFNSNFRRCALCRQSMPGCAKCNFINNCLTCQSGFYLSRFDTCRVCDFSIESCCSQFVNNCLKCNSSTTCILCKQKYYLNGSKCSSCSSIVDLNCLNCNSTTCRECSAGFYLFNTTSCIPCHQAILNCTECINQTHCTKCTTKFLLVQNQCLNCPRWPLTNDFYIDSFKACHSCDNATSNCKKCGEDGVCIQCIGLFYLSDKLCKSCKDNLANCLICKSTYKCQFCDSGYYLGFDDVKTCKKCSDRVSNCRECTQIFQQQIKKASISCKLCEPQYISEQGQCKSCLQVMSNCLTCTYKMCQQCQKSYFLSYNGQSCVLCPEILEGCLTCKSSIDCQLCSQEYYLQYSQCVKCSFIIQNCKNCVFYNVSNNVICQKCDNRFYWDGLGCKSCASKFEFCSICSASGCEICIDGSYVNRSGLCSPCSLLMAGCVHCSSDLVCLICGQHSFLQRSSNRCRLCSELITGCQQCVKIGQTYNCTKCSKSYATYLDNLNRTSICLACNVTLSNCQICTIFSKCDKCLTAYFINFNQKCSLCSAFIKNCQLCSNSLSCLTCTTSYILSKNGSCSLCNLSYFGKELINSKFQPTCKSCGFQNNVLICNECVEGHYFDAPTQSCQKCNKLIQNCFSCALNLICLQCLPSFYLSPDNKQCISCLLEGCSQCKDNICTKCLPQSYLSIQRKTCRKCYDLSIGCKTCDSENCYSCSDGYFIEKNSCQPCSIAMTYCILCDNNFECLLKLEPSLPNEGPYFKPLGLIFIILSVIILIVFVIWFKFFKKQTPQDELLQDIKIQTHRRMNAQQVYSNEIALQKGKICQSCLQNDSQVMSLELLCKECDQILQRGNSHKIKQQLHPIQEIKNPKSNIQDQVEKQEKKDKIEDNEEVVHVVNNGNKKQSFNKSTKFQSSNKKPSSINYRQMF